MMFYIQLLAQYSPLPFELKSDADQWKQPMASDS